MKNHGFNLEEAKKDITPDDYALGGGKVYEDVLVENGNWTSYLPVSELQQKNGLETMNCVSYGTQNCLELLMCRKFGICNLDYSERFIGVLAETSPQGNTPNKVAQTIRHSGVIPEEVLPFHEGIDTWEKYYFPNPMTNEYLWTGKGWLKKYIFYHEWVAPVEKELMKALKHSPVGIAVEAWKQRKGLYYSNGVPNHWVALIGYKEKEYWIIEDQYKPFIKKLEWGYPFQMAKVYFVEENKGQRNWLLGMIIRIWEVVKQTKTFGVARNPQWQLLSEQYREKNPKCELCGRKSKETHHIIPVHIDKSKELDWKNLVAVCRNCHWNFGHFFSWYSYNEKIKDDIVRIKSRP